MGLARAVSLLRDSRSADCGALWFWGREPERGASDRAETDRSARRFMAIRSTSSSSAILRALQESSLSHGDLRPGDITFALGGISAWVPTFLHRANGLSVANASLVVGAITVIDGIAGTIVGGWIAHRWLRTDHRALYLVSFWSVVLTLPFGILVFFGPHSTTIPALFLAEFFIFLNTGPLNAAIVNSVGGAGARHGHLHQPFLHSRIRRYVLAADYRRHQRPLELEHRSGRDAGFAGDRVRGFCGMARASPRPYCEEQCRNDARLGRAIG